MVHVLTTAMAFTRKMAGRFVFFLLPNSTHAAIVGAFRFTIHLLKPGKTWPRRYLRPGVKLETLFVALKERNVNYVVLRWFDKLPFVDPEEDIDILVADEDLKTLKDLFVYFPGGQAFDIYSTTGKEGADYKGIPYYPPQLAKQLLSSRIWKDDLYAVCSEKYHFLSLAYHAVFHKGQTSGLPHARETTPIVADHDYAAILSDMAHNSMGLNLNMEFEALFEYLEKNSWIPEADTLRKLAADDAWLYRLLPSENETEAEGELVVFVIREWAYSNNKIEFIKRHIEGADMDILIFHMLDPAEKKRAWQKVRGGKWDKGPYPISGGFPVAFVVCFDYHPRKVTETQQKIHPFIKNANVYLKNNIRDRINCEIPFYKHTNCIHSADNEHEAWEYIKRVLPERAEKVRGQVELRRQIYETVYPVLKLFASNRTRAKIELIDYHGQKAVKKTFKLGMERFFEREKYVYEVFSHEDKHIPPLLASGRNYIILPWYDDILSMSTIKDRRGLIKVHAKEIVQFLHFTYEKGYALIGFYPGNLLITRNGDLKFIDFEFLYKYNSKPKSFMASYDIAGRPGDFEGDVPKGSTDRGHTYKNTWESILGDISQYI